MSFIAQNTQLIRLKMPTETVKSTFTTDALRIILVILVFWFNSFRIKYHKHIDILR